MPAQTIGGDQADVGQLMDEWRQANDHVRSLELAEAGFPDNVPVADLPPGLQAAAAEIQASPVFQRSSQVVPSVIGMVELDRLVVHQKHIELAHVRRIQEALGPDPTDNAVLRMCLPFGEERPEVNGRRVGPNAYMFTSPSNDLRLLEPVMLRADQLVGYTPPGHAISVVALVPSTGIVLAKIADQVHSGAQQLQFVDFVNAARAEGFTVCDYSVKTRAAGIEDPKWTHRYHVRKPWSFWVVARAGASCKGPGASLLRICPSCDLPFKAARSDAVTCSTRCRQRRRRRTASTSKSDLAHISHVTSFTVRGLTEV